MGAKTFYRQTSIAIATYLAQELRIRPGVHWKICNATSGPRVLTLNLLLNPTYAKRIVGMAEALSMAAGLDKDASLRVSRGHRGTLCLEVPKPVSLWYNVSVQSLPRRRGLLASVGLDGDHRPAAVNFADPLTPHALVAGATGSGKTNVQRLLVYDLALQNTPDRVQFVLIDTHKRGKWWRDFAHLPHLLHGVITDDQTALRALMWATAEIDRRAEADRTKPVAFICIDEVQALLDRDACLYHAEVGALLKDLTAIGREFGLHCVLGLQNPTAEMMGGTANLKRNVVARLVGKVDGGTAAYAATGQKDSGAERLVGSGDFLLVEPRGVKRLTAALPTERDVARLPRVESVPSLDLEQHEDVDHVLGQAGSEARSVTGFDILETALSIIAAAKKRGRPWLKDVLEAEVGQRPGSTRADRLLEWGRAVYDLPKQYQHLIEAE